MDTPFTHQEEREAAHLQNQHQQLKLCLPLVRFRGPNTQNPFSIFGFCLSKYIRNLYSRARISNSCCLGRLTYNGMVVNNSAFCDSPGFIEEGIAEMEGLIEKIEGVEVKSEGFDETVGKVETFGELIEIEEKGRESCSSSDFLTSETTGPEEQSHSSSEASSSPPSLGWPVQKSEAPDCTSQNGTEAHLGDRKLEKQGSTISGIVSISFTIRHVKYMYLWFWYLE